MSTIVGMLNDVIKSTKELTIIRDRLVDLKNPHSDVLVIIERINKAILELENIQRSICKMY